MSSRIHRSNHTERAIKTFKTNFIAGLSSTDTNFPMQAWCRLLPQSKMTLDILRSCRLNPTLSVYTQLQDTPQGTKICIGETPTK